MDRKVVIEVSTKSYEEEQFMLTNFPDVVWISGIKTFSTFFIPFNRKEELDLKISKFEKGNKNG